MNAHLVTTAPQECFQGIKCLKILLNNTMVNVLLMKLLFVACRPHNNYCFHSVFKWLNIVFSMVKMQYKKHIPLPSLLCKWKENESPIGYINMYIYEGPIGYKQVYFEVISCLPCWGKPNPNAEHQILHQTGTIQCTVAFIC